MNIQTPGKLSKFQRYRANKKAAGFKEVRIWVRDTGTPAFKQEMERVEREYRTLPYDPDLETFADEVLADAFKTIPPL